MIECPCPDDSYTFEDSGKQTFWAVKSVINRINQNYVLTYGGRKRGNYFRWVVRNGLFQKVTSALRVT